MMGQNVVVEAATADPAAAAGAVLAVELAPLVARVLARRARLHLGPVRVVFTSRLALAEQAAAAEASAAGVPAEGRGALAAHTRRRLRGQCAATVIAPDGCLVLVAACPPWLLDTVLLHQLALAALLDRPGRRALHVRAIRHRAGVGELSRRDAWAMRSLARRDRRRATRIERRLPRRLAQLAK